VNDGVDVWMYEDDVDVKKDEELLLKE